MKKTLRSVLILCSTALLLSFSQAADSPFSGLDMNLGNLSRLSKAKTRSIGPENLTGEKGKAGMSTDGAAKGAARDLGQGWKVSPFVRVPAKSTFTLAEITGPGAIQQIWMTPAPLDKTRWDILRFYWDDETEPSIECPLGDFFACGWGRYCQINYTLTDVPEDAAYFHAQFRRENPLKSKGLYTILDGVEGAGQYVGTYLAWGTHNTGWWGEGEIKFYMDGDKEFPTICGTGTEDYFCGSYDFEIRGVDGKGHYVEFSTPYSGLPQVIRPDGLYDSQQRFGLYRWHIMDPIRFEQDLKVTIQALGWQSGGRYLQLQDDIASVAFWYQKEPHRKFPKLPSRDELELH